MAQYNFEGDIIGISDCQLEFINNVIQEQGFGNGKITFAPVGQAGDNFAASVKRITLEGESGNFSMIVKVAPTNETIRQRMVSAVIFRNEHVMYTEVLPKYAQLQQDAGIPENEQLKFPKCYGSFAEKPNEVILLEDLKTSNFTMLDRFQPLSDDCVKSILKNFASLHSLSFVLKHKEPLTFENFKTSLIDMWAVKARAEKMHIFFQSLENQALAIIENPTHINLIRHKIADTMNAALKFMKEDQDNKYSVILHGDAWTNNFMFKQEKNGDVAESILIDYQIARNSSPAIDIMYMIFCCTDYKTRKQHYYEWLDYYHSELENRLSDFNLKANFVYPRDKFDADLKRYAKYSLGLCVCLTSMLIRKSDDAAKVVAPRESIESEHIKKRMEAISVMSLDEESIALYKDRLLGLIESYVDFGLL